MTSRYLHTMLRVTDPEKSRAFYEALGMEFRRESPIVRNGELEATLYFFGYPGQEEELELTFNHDGSTYELGTAYGHIAIGVDDIESTLSELAGQGTTHRIPNRDGARRAVSCTAGRPTFFGTVCADTAVGECGTGRTTSRKRRSQARWPASPRPSASRAASGGPASRWWPSWSS